MIEARTLAGNLRILGLENQAAEADKLAAMPGMPESLLIERISKGEFHPRSRQRFGLDVYEFIKTTGDKIQGTADDENLDVGEKDYSVDYDLGGARVTVYKTTQDLVIDPSQEEDPSGPKRLKSLYFLIQDVGKSKTIKSSRKWGFFKEIEAVRINIDPLDEAFGSVDEPETLEYHGRIFVNINAFQDGDNTQKPPWKRTEDLARLMFDLLKDSSRFRREKSAEGRILYK